MLIYYFNSLSLVYPMEAPDLWSIYPTQEV